MPDLLPQALVLSALVVSSLALGLWQQLAGVLKDGR